MHVLRSIILLAVVSTAVGTLAGQPKSGAPKPDPRSETPKARVTFVELGSVKCIPCRQMQPVMRAIEKKYGGQVRVVFHDIGTDSGSTHAEKYKIRLIPTQVFLDDRGKEFFRHEGFYPEAEIDTLFRKRGLTVMPAGPVP